MKKILIDTDVILDFFFDRQPFSENSAIILSKCEQKQIKGYVTPVIISNVYYLLRRTASHDKVIKKLKELITITHVLQMDKQIIEDALQSGFKDFEDALQNFSAVRNGDIEAIITRNIKDFKKSEIGVLTPESYVKLLNA
ncbi:MAG: PIN domain-containing protein [Bacteroidetes bacterium]|nr:PIN domain-containing protein [Bacteroidota bacterium]